MRARHAHVALVAALIALSASGCGATTYGSSSGGTTGNVGQTGGTAGGTTGGGTTGGSGGSGGDVSQPAGAGNYSCEFKFDPIQGGASVKGTVWTKCAEPPRQHHLTIYLYRYTDTWTEQNRKSYDRIPIAMPTPNLVTAPCVPGRWQMVVSIDGISATGIPWHVDNVTSPEREIQPHDCD